MKLLTFIIIFLFTLNLLAIDQVTIYNENFSLVRSTVELSLKKGIQSYFMDDIPSTIEANSVIIKPLKGSLEVFSQNYEYDLANTSKILNKYIGKQVEIIGEEGTKYIGNLQFNDNSAIGILENTTDKLILINTEEIRSINLAELPKNFFLKPTLHWRLDSKKVGNIPIDFSYICTGMKWDVTYNTVWNEDNKELNINSWVTIKNNTGKEFLETKLKLIAGDVRKIHEYYESQRRATYGLEAPKTSAPEFTEKEFHDFHMYTLNEKVNINNNQTKQLRLFPAKTVTAESRYEYHTGSNEIKSIIKFNNSKKNGLGIPLPKGVIKIYKTDKTDNELEFIGEDNVDHTTKGEDVMINTGNAFDLVGETITVDRETISKRTYQRKMKVILKNRSNKFKTITVMHGLYGKWTIINNTLDFNKIDASSIEFTKKLKPNEVYEFTWTERIES